MSGRGAAAMLGAMPLRCLIVDDNAAFLEASRALLEGQAITVVGAATTAAAGLQRCMELEPDVTLVDIDLGGDSGLELARQLADRSAGASAVVLISAHPEEDFADLIAESPAAGFIPKSELSTAAIRDLVGRSEAA
jgi:DNA-binding NarL/FixJ family response regulator